MMNKAFVKEGRDDILSLLPDMPVGVRNYITPAGYRRLQDELLQLTARFEAQQADPSDDHKPGEPSPAENREHQLREIDQRIHYLRARLDTAEIVDPSMHHGNDQIFFGATVSYESAAGERHTITIVGLDELDPTNGKISWLSPVAQTLLKAHEGDSVLLNSPAGAEKLHVLDVRYPQAQE
jgi:transcription elongation factor GreB